MLLNIFPYISSHNSHHYNNNPSKYLKILIFAFAIILFSTSALAVQQLISLQGKVDLNGVLVSSGSVNVTIWDASAGGNVVYNSTGDFINSVQNGYFDITLGATTELNLSMNRIYWLDMEVNGNDIDWNGNERLQFQSPVGSNVFGNLNITDNLTVDTNTLYVDAINNKVGIGTATPNVNLDVLSSSPSTFAYISAGNSNLSSWVELSGGTSSVNPAIVWYGEKTSLTFGTTVSGQTSAPLFLMNLTSTGRLGIGAFNPSAKLEVSGSANVLALNVNNTLYVNTTTSNVGIGTTGPGSLLHIKGATDAHIYETIEATKSANAQLDAAIHYKNGNTNGDWYTGLVPSVIDSGKNGFGFYDTSNALVRMYIQNDGNVGIGTTSPNATLNVRGGVNVTGSVNLATLEGNVGIGTASPNATLNVRGGVNVTGSVNLATLEGKVGINTTSPAGTLHVSTGGVDALVVQNQTGKVGIGTAGPGAQLEIKTTKASGSLASDYVLSLIDATKTNTYYYDKDVYGLKVLGANSLSDAAIVYKNAAIYAKAGTIDAPNANEKIYGLYVEGNGVGTDAAVFMNGSVGIGTTAPDARLQINATNSTGGSGGGLVAALRIINTTGSELVYVNGTTGKVGIGTATPSTPLHLEGAPAGAHFITMNNTGAGGKWARLATGTGGLELSSNGTMGFVNATGSYVILINQTGNVGIGTTNPATPLHIRKDQDASTRVSIQNANVHNDAYSSVDLINDQGGTGFQIGLYSSGTGQPNEGFLYQSLNAPIGIWNGGIRRMVITSAGNIGINTTAPLATLNVVGTVVLNGTANTLALNVNNSLYVNTTTSWIGIGNATPAGTFQVSTSGVPAFIVQNVTGNVGIGTTGPDQKLHVYNPTSGQETFIKLEAQEHDTTLQFASSFTGSRREIGAIKVYRDNSGGQMRLRTTDTSGVAQDRVTILNTGNVGIGTTSPNATLQVMGAANTLALNVNNTLYVNTTTSNVGIGTTGPGAKLEVMGTANFGSGSTVRIDDNILRLNSAASNAVLQFSANNLLIYGGTSGLRYLDSDGADRVKIDSTGNIGINTTSPSDRVHLKGGDQTSYRVESTGNANARYMMNNTQGSWGIMARGTTGNFDIYDYDMGGESVSIKSGMGMVGIGTVNPTENLTVNGNFSAKNGNITGSINLATSEGRIGIGTTSPNAKLEVNGTLIVNSSGNVGLWSNGTNVGIGTTSPGAKLDILGASSSTMRIVSAAGTIPAYLDGQAFKGIYIATPSGSGDYPGIETVDTIGTHMVFAGNTVGTLSNHDLRILTNSNDRVRITADGKVGIGTTGPSAKLDIIGNLTVNGTSTSSSSGITLRNQTGGLICVFAENTTFATKIGAC